MSKAKRKKTATEKEQDCKKSHFNMLNINGEKYRTILTEKFKNRKKWEYPNPKLICSQIPGTILKICVKEGDKVSEGDSMIVLESMKMKNKLEFHMDGVVKKIHVEENERIPKSHLMVELK